MKRKFYFQPNSIIVWDFFFRGREPRLWKSVLGFFFVRLHSKVTEHFQNECRKLWTDLREMTCSGIIFRIVKFAITRLLEISTNQIWLHVHIAFELEPFKVSHSSEKTSISCQSVKNVYFRWKKASSIFSVNIYTLWIPFEFLFWIFFLKAHSSKFIFAEQKNGNWKFFTVKVHGNLKGAQSRYFELFWQRTKLPWNWRKPENNSSLRQKNMKEITINRKGTRMVKDGKDWHGLLTTNVKGLG